MTLTPERLHLQLPRNQAALLAERLRLAVQDGYDQDGLLANLRQQAEAVVEGRDLQTRVICKECGHSFTEIPTTTALRCPACTGRHLRVETPGGGIS